MILTFGVGELLWPCGVFRREYKSAVEYVLKVLMVYCVIYIHVWACVYGTDV